MADHQAASKAPLTSKLAMITTLPLYNSGSRNWFTAIAASVVLFWGVNPNWLSFMWSILYMWCIILLISNFSSNFPPMFSKLIVRYLDGCRLSSSRVELLISHRVPPRVADREMLARYGGYWGNKIPGADQNQYRCLAVDRGICKG